MPANFVGALIKREGISNLISYTELLLNIDTQIHRYNMDIFRFILKYVYT
jgi:hypothetical protein